MFGAGWTEMLIIGIVALVVIGPKDLPIVMRKIGRVVGTVRRMGGEFQRELNKTTGLDQIADLKRSITEPLRQTSQEIANEFNRQTTTGVEPSGVIAPTDPKVESVYDKIAATAGVPATEIGVPPPPVMKPLSAAEPLPGPGEAAILPPATPAKRRNAKAKPVAEPVVDAKPAAGKTPAKAAAAKTAIATAMAKPKAAARKPAVAKPSAGKPAAAVSPAPLPLWDRMPPAPETVAATPEPAAALARRRPTAKAASPNTAAANSAAARAKKA